MRILFVAADRFDENPGGYGIYSRQIVDGFAEFAEVYTTTLSVSATGFVARSGMQRVRQAAGFHGVNGFSHRSMRAMVVQLRELIDRCEPDVIVYNHLRAAELMATTLRPPSVYIAHNAESRLPASGVEWAFRRTVRRLEAAVVRSVDLVVCLTPQDQTILRRIDPSATSIVVPPRLDELRGPVPRRPEQVVMLSGSFHWRPKRQAAQRLACETMPVVWASNPGARLVLAGSGAERVRASDPRIVRPQEDHVDDWWDRAAVAVAPDRQPGGLKLKVLQAAVRQVPLVATPESLEGTGLRAPSDVVTLSENGLANAIMKVLDDPDGAARRAIRAAEHVERAFGAAAHEEHLEDLRTHMTSIAGA